MHSCINTYNYIIMLVHVKAIYDAEPLKLACIHTCQGRRNTFKTRGAEDSRYTRGRFASGASEKNFEAN